jgi:hypothetical protein
MKNLTSLEKMTDSISDEYSEYANCLIGLYKGYGCSISEKFREAIESELDYVECSLYSSVSPPRVFLGGTCNDSTWRQRLIPILEANRVDYFDPVVADWTPQCQANEIAERTFRCDYILYTITPLMLGAYSVAEVVEDSIRRPDRTIMCLLAYDDGQTFGSAPFKSLNSVADMVTRNGGKVFRSIEEVGAFLVNST